jgi:hypothetical protein
MNLRFKYGSKDMPVGGLSGQILPDHGSPVLLYLPGIIFSGHINNQFLKFI